MGPTPHPRPSATVVLLRDSPAGLKVLLTKRPKHFRFMGGATVFPGGAVAAEDRDPRWASISVLSPRDAATVLGESDPLAALATFVCALREAFEEVGWVSRPEAARALEGVRRAEGERPWQFLEGCLEASIKLATDRLVPAGRWVTPLGSPVRFDTRFFLAEAGADWQPTPHPHEVADCGWATPSEALEELAAGAAVMAPPTVEMLQRLATHDSVEAAMDALEDAAAESGGGVPGGRPLTARLSPSVVSVLAPNPGPLTGPGTNTYIVGRGEGRGRAVIDPATGDPAFIESVLTAAGAVSVIAVTHRHPDHVGGVAALVEATRAPVRAFGPEPAGGVGVEPLADREEVAVAGTSLRALHLPGHSSDHLCLLLEEEAATASGLSLIAGDNILGEGTAVIAPPDGDMRAYLASLARLARLDIGRIYPGHFRPIESGRAIVEGYIVHRRARSKEILGALATGPATVAEIVDRIYTATPQSLKGVAAQTVLAHLVMLREDGAAMESSGRWTTLA